MRLNKTIQQIKPSGIREFFDIVSTMPDALALGVGEPDFATPWFVRDSAIKSILRVIPLILQTKVCLLYASV